MTSSLLGCMVETIINHSNCIAQSHWPVMMIIIITNEEKKFFSFWPDRQEKIFELLQEAKLGAMLGRITWYAKLPLD